jgi:hypothetical protein
MWDSPSRSVASNRCEVLSARLGSTTEKASTGATPARTATLVTEGVLGSTTLPAVTAVTAVVTAVSRSARLRLAATKTLD